MFLCQINYAEGNKAHVANKTKDISVQQQAHQIAGGNALSKRPAWSLKAKKMQSRKPE
jgi:hypothetical protein